MFAMCLPVTSAQAQMRTGTVSHTYLQVNLSLNLDSLRLGKKQSLVITLVISDGKHQQALRPVRVNGTWRHLIYKRQESNVVPTDCLTVKCGKTGAGIINYVDSCIYLPWMNGAKVFLSRDLCGCGGDPMEQTLQQLATVRDNENEMKLIPLQPAKTMEQVTESVRHKVVKVTLFLDYLAFPVNRMEILPGFGNNRVELHKLQTALDSLLTLHEVKIDLVSMTGYASPEGPYRHNEELAYGRTLALRDYLQDILRYRELPFRTASVAEDWQGLKVSLENSDMPYKEELLLIIASNLSPDEKEDRIRMLDGGKAYRILKSAFLPKLRRTVCEIHYTETYETE